jgi:hypothetical protein
MIALDRSVHVTSTLNSRAPSPSRASRLASPADADASTHRDAITSSRRARQPASVDAPSARKSATNRSRRARDGLARVRAVGARDVDENSARDGESSPNDDRASRAFARRARVERRGRRRISSVRGWIEGTVRRFRVQELARGGEHAKVVD